MGWRNLTALAFALGTAGVLSACTAIIGVKDIFLDEDMSNVEAGSNPESGSGPNTDASSAADAGPSTDSGPGPGPDAGDSMVIQETGTDGPITCNNTQTDPMNCGRCGHDCLGGSCAAGECQPVPVAQALRGPYAIAVDDTYVFWTDDTANTVMRANKADGGGLIALTAGADAGVDNPVSLVLGDTHVFWANYPIGDEAAGVIRRCDKTGCAGTVATVYHAGTTDGGSAPYSLAIDSTRLYFTEYSSHVASITRAGTGFADLGTTTSPVHIVTDSTNIYFTDDWDESVYKCPVSGCGASPTAIASSQGPLNGITQDATDLYWTSRGDTGALVARIAKNAPPSTQPSVIAANQVNALSVVVDADNVYWVSHGKSPDYLDGAVLRCPKTGCPGTGPKILASNLRDPRRMAIDSVAIYWTVHGVSGNEGSVMRLAK